MRRIVAHEFSQYLRDTAEGHAPWNLFELKWSTDDLINFADNFPDRAIDQLGFGDMTIIDAFEDYKERAPGISVRIWSTDGHLMAFQYVAPEIGCRSRG